MITPAGTLKTDLHLHLYGCLTPAMLAEDGMGQARRHPDRVAWFEKQYQEAFGETINLRTVLANAERIEELFKLPHHASFAQFQAVFNLTIALYPFSVGETNVLERVLKSHANDQVRQLTEYRVFVPPNLPSEDLHQHLTNLAERCLEFEGDSYQPRLAISLPRDEALADFLHDSISQWQSKSQSLSTALTGLDFCGDETQSSPGQLDRFFQRVLTRNRRAPQQALAILYHVGEVFGHVTPASSIRHVMAAAASGCHRLGHATILGIRAEDIIPAAESPQETRSHLNWLIAHHEDLAHHGYLVDVEQCSDQLRQTPSPPPWDEEDFTSLQEAALSWIRELGTVIETCPTSNLKLSSIAGPEHHPCRRFLEKGISLVIGTDDPGIFSTSLAEEGQLLKQHLGLTEADLRHLEKTATNCRSEAIAGRWS